VKKNKSGEEFS